MEVRFFNFGMKRILLPLSLVFSLTVGITCGVAFERFTNREECLKESYTENQSDLSPEEIESITQALNSGQEEGESVDIDTDQGNSNNNGNKQIESGAFVGSRNSNKFYPIDCRFAKLIKDENKVFFNSVEEGEKAGRKYIECN